LHAKGIWGTYPDAVIPDLYIVEGGQTSTGSIVNWLKHLLPDSISYDKLLCGCQAHYIRDLFFLSSFMTTVLPDQRETCCYAWHGTRSSHLLGMRPSLRHKAPGSLSQASNRQEFFSPGSACRRVVPWGDVSSWVKGAE